MTRRNHHVRWLVLASGVLGAALIVALALLWRTSEPGRPTALERWRGAAAPLNVVLITVDTLRADRLGSYGSRRVATPNMDALAAEGVRFDNAASAVPFTLPAHSTLMTGTYPPHHGVRENVGYTLDDSLPTLAERLAAGGWTTGGFVSAFVLDSRWGIGRGFSTYFDDFDPQESGSTNLGSVQRDGAETIDAAVSWLGGQPQRPLFLWLHLFEPHDPYTPPEPYLGRYAGRPYDGEVAYADALVGRFREALEQRGLLDSSLLILTGDHGEGLGQHREGFHGFFVYDSTVRVPLIVRPPFPDLAGTVIAEPVSHVDLLPTILEAVGQPVPEHAQGRSLLPLLEAGDEAGGRERAVYSESMYPLLHYGWAPLRSIRTSRYKFIDAPQPELYDLTADPLEETNVLRQQRQVSSGLRERLQALVSAIEAGDRSPSRPVDMDEETLQQLEALGYLAGRGGVSIEDEGARERADPKERIDLHQLVMSAQSSLGKGEVDAAGVLLEQALAEDSSMVDAHQMLGTIAMQKERFGEAGDHFAAALEVKDDHLASLYGLANAYRRMGREEEALLGFKRLLQLHPGDSKAAVAAADLLNREDRRSEAIAVLETALEQEKPAALLFNQLGELRALDGDSLAAVRLFERALAVNEDLVVGRFNLAVLYVEQGRTDEAVALYEGVVERAPRHFQALFNVGRLYGRRGETAKQQRSWEAAIAANPDFVVGYFYLAKLLMDRGEELTRAEKLVREGLVRDPEHRTGPLGYYVLADILNRTGESRQAAQAAETGRRIEAEQQGGA